MIRPFKVRFHLGAGKNYMTWRVEDLRTKEVNFYQPDEVCIEMGGCKLYNQKGMATKIYEGRNRSVCAFIRCDNIMVHVFDAQPMYVTVNRFAPQFRISYNPKTLPYWRDAQGKDIDKTEHTSIVTKDRSLFTT